MPGGQRLDCTLQMTPDVNPAFVTPPGFGKVTTVGSKVKSPWNDAMLSLAEIVVVITARVKVVTVGVLTLAFGRKT